MNNTKKIIISGVFLALCILLPFLTGNSRQLGTLLSLMHIPVLLCGFICGWQYGLAVGFVAPLLRSMLLGMPPMPIVAVPMAFELAAYGIICGLLYKFLPKRKLSVYVSLVCAMVIGRLVNVAAAYMFGTTAILASLQSVFIGTFVGIIIQIIVIPIIVIALKKSGYINNETNRNVD